jgi:predicted ATPase
MAQQQQRLNQISATDRQHRFLNAVTKIVEAIGSVLPLVLVLENIMWADSGSLQLLQSLCITGKLSNVLLVATCRDDEVGFHDPLSVKLRTMEDRGLRLTDIRVPPLSAEHVHDFILTLVGNECCKESYREMARLVHRCTNGNPLLVCEILGVIEQEGLNSELLRKKLDYGHFINAKVSQIPSSRKVLQLIACLGEQMVHESVLKELLQESESEIRNDLIAAQEQGILCVNAESGECAFVHTNAQSAIYDLIPNEEKSSIHYNIAELLCHWLTEEHIEENIFLIVDQYLKGSNNIPMKETEKVAQLCLRAARNAAHASAFTSAENFIEFGLSLLVPRTKWRDTYRLTLDLTNAAIELEFCHGNHNSVDTLHEEITLHSRTAMDSVTSYTIHISSLGSRGRLSEAIAESIQILDRLGERIPRRFLAIRTVNGLLKMKNVLKKTDDKEILELPLLKDAKIQAVMNILHLMFVYTFMSQSNLVPIVSMRAIELTRQFGLNPLSMFSKRLGGYLSFTEFHLLRLSLFTILQVPQVLQYLEWLR